MVRLKTLVYGNNKAVAGFTLVEVLVVLTVFMIVLSISSPLFKSEKVSLESNVRELVSHIKFIRSKSITTGSVKNITFDVDNKMYFIPSSNKRHVLDNEIDFEIVLDDIDTKGKSANIKFYPDGSNSGAIIMLSYKKKFSRINVSWLTGKITVDNGLI